MAILDLTLYGDPIAKGRPRMSPNGHTYTPERTRAGERAVSVQVMAAMRGAVPVDVAVGVAVEFHCATRRRTDGDNLLKLVTDAMNGIVIVDDSQIEEWFCRIIRGVGKANACTQILVYELRGPSGEDV
jgi:Holliday junction resolvase RusA-like endonuclease